MLVDELSFGGTPFEDVAKSPLERKVDVVKTERSDAASLVDIAAVSGDRTSGKLSDKVEVPLTS